MFWVEIEKASYCQTWTR